MQPFPFTAQRGGPAPLNHMAEALALVRAGKLDAASRLLMDPLGAALAPG